jgi:hypothetical protein
MRSLIAVAAIATQLTLLTGIAQADQSPASSRLVWNEQWQRVTGWNLAATGALAATSLGLTLGTSPERRWTGGILFDDAVRDAVRIDEPGLQDRVAKASDVIYPLLALYPVAIDSGLVAWGIHGSSDVAGQTAVISLQSLALAGAVTITAISFVGRQRPRELGCENDPTNTRCDDPGSNKSFFSGHSAASFTAAGLICTHHAELPLYGGGAGDVLACSLGLFGATTVAAFRVMSDSHWPTDVALGSTVGAVSGFLVPRLLHYGFGQSGPARVAIAPLLSPTARGLTLFAAF